MTIAHHEHRMGRAHYQALQESLEDPCGDGTPLCSMKRNAPLGLTAVSMFSEKSRPVAVTTSICPAGA